MPRCSKQIGKAHDAQADLAVFEGRLLNLGQGETVGVDDVVQEMDRGPDDVF